MRRDVPKFGQLCYFINGVGKAKPFVYICRRYKGSQRHVLLTLYDTGSFVPGLHFIQTTNQLHMTILGKRRWLWGKELDDAIRNGTVPDPSRDSD